MGAAFIALAALEIAVRGRGTALARHELVWIHRKAHRAAGFSPVEAGLEEYLVQALGLGLLLYQAGARNDHRLDVGTDHPAISHARDLAQVLDAGVGTGTD